MKFIERLRQLLCGLRGHDRLTHFEGNRVMLRCSNCKHDTPVWEITGRGPRQRFEGDKRRHVIVPNRLLVHDEPLPFPRGPLIPKEDRELFARALSSRR